MTYSSDPWNVGKFLPSIPRMRSRSHRTPPRPRCRDDGDPPPAACRCCGFRAVAVRAWLSGSWPSRGWGWITRETPRRLFIHIHCRQPRPPGDRPPPAPPARPLGAASAPGPKAAERPKAPWGWVVWESQRHWESKARVAPRQKATPTPQGGSPKNKIARGKM